MATKAELTSEFILKTVAPVFNRNGYAATSMAQITKATGLTKGAVYGNFTNKEELAVKAFNHNIRLIVGVITEKINAEVEPEAKLRALTNFYRNYYHLTRHYGGCPILNVGVDSKNQNPILLKRVREVVHKLKNGIADIIELGIDQGKFRKELDSEGMAMKILTLIEGGIFMSTLLDQESQMKTMLDVIDTIIDREILL